jgi:mRNA interferase HigB
VIARAQRERGIRCRRVCYTADEQRSGSAAVRFAFVGLERLTSSQQGIILFMRIIAVKTLRLFWQEHPDSAEALKAWVAEAEASDWQGPEDVKRRYGSADVLAGNRIVFNIKGNRYRLVVKIHYNTGFVFVRFIGTHQGYSRIDAETI